MREIGVRELKRSLSETLRSVGRGEHVRVTVRGQAIADLVPLGPIADDDRLHTLALDGKLSRASQSAPAQRPPQTRAERSASDAVLADRNNER
jgi:prevent-host-death family protein